MYLVKPGYKKGRIVKWLVRDLETRRRITSLTLMKGWDLVEELVDAHNGYGFASKLPDDDLLDVLIHKPPLTRKFTPGELYWYLKNTRRVFKEYERKKRKRAWHKRRRERIKLEKIKQQQEKKHDEHVSN
jgi:hypothetical protein